MAKIHGYEPVSASLDVIRRGREPGVRQLAQDLPPVGTMIELVIGEVRSRDHEPRVWVDLTAEFHDRTSPGSNDAAADAVPPSRPAVEAGWQRVRADGRVRTELIDAAYAEPRLRQLFPWTGMGELHFSRCTEKHWTWDIPYIQPAEEGKYWVSGPSRSQSVGPAATAEQAVEMVVARLPHGSGPAFVGTPQEFSAHEAANANPGSSDPAQTS